MVGRKILELWLFGGNSNNGSDCGLAYANSNNGWTNSNANYSARLTTFIGSNVEKIIRMSVLRHGKAFGYLEPRQRARRYSTCLVGTTFTLRGIGSAHPPVVLVSQKWI